MGFFDFLRDKKVIEKPTESKKVERYSSTNELKEDIDKNTRDIDEAFLVLERKAKILLNRFLPLLEDNLKSFKLINLDNRREDKRLKEIVIENLNFYIDNLEKLLGKLREFNNTNEKNIKKNFIFQINSEFEGFIRNSKGNYQKATILIGKEFEAVQKTFKDFSLEFNSLIKENQALDMKLEELGKRKDMLANILDLDKAENEIREMLIKLDSEKTLKNKTIEEREKELRKLKESEAYKKDSEKRKDIEKELQEIDKEIASIEKKVDLKELARKYHYNEKKNRLLQQYIENFRRTVEEDKNQEFEELVKENRGLVLNFHEINKKIRGLKEHNTSSEIVLKELEREIEDLKKSIIDIEKTREAGEAKLERFKEKKEKLFDSTR